MHTIVNHLPIQPGTNWDDMKAKFDAFVKQDDPAFAAVRTVQLLKASETEAIFVVTFDDLDALNAFSANVAGPWFAANLRQYLAGPANRTVAEMIAGYA
jgi:hypothetical protein